VLWDARPVAILVEDLPPGRHSKPDYWGWRDEEPSWTWPGWEGQPRVVRVYAKGDQAKLLLDGKEIATQPIDAQLTATFSVPYAPGTLTAEAQKNGKTIAKDMLVTAGPPAAIRLTVENPGFAADSQSIVFVDVEAVDAQGHLAPLANNPVRIALSGRASLTNRRISYSGGTLLAFGNGDPRNVGSVQHNTQNLWRGRALLIVRSNGSQEGITVEATAAGLKPDLTTIEPARD
jgi:beta-galactosidase